MSERKIILLCFLLICALGLVAAWYFFAALGGMLSAGWLR